MLGKSRKPIKIVGPPASSCSSTQSLKHPVCMHVCVISECVCASSSNLSETFKGIKHVKIYLSAAGVIQARFHERPNAIVQELRCCKSLYHLIPSCCIISNVVYNFQLPSQEDALYRALVLIWVERVGILTFIRPTLPLLNPFVLR